MGNLTDLPRASLGLYPTPFYKLEAVSAKYGRNIWIKRDDLCGVALGGGKVRGLEFLLAQAKAEGCDTVLTAGGSLSGHPALTAACAARLGMDCLLFLEGRSGLALAELYGARVRLTDTGDAQSIGREMDRTAGELEAQGRRCRIIPVGGSTPLGALGCVSAARECAVQAMAAGIRVGHLVSAAETGGTTAGLLLGASRFLHGARVTGMEVGPDSLRETVLDLAAQAAGLLEVPFQPKEDDLRLRGCAGPGYGIPDPAALPAIRELARTEGVLLDPVCTGKAWAGLLTELEAGGFDGEDDIVFFHTGGGALLAQDLPEAST